MAYVDAHCHLHFQRMAKVLPAVLAEAKQNGIQWFVVNSTSPEDFDSISRLSQSNGSILPCFGIHPYKVEETTILKNYEYLEKYCSTIQTPFCIGEIGLDKSIVEQVPMNVQEDIFRKQVQLARKLSVPFIVHCVKCVNSVYSIIKEECISPTPFLMHGYSASADFVPKFTSLGAYFSISGYLLNLSPKRRKAMEDSIRKIPLDHLLFESDAPDMIIKSSVNESTSYDENQIPINTPSCILQICREVAEIRGIDPEVLRETVYQNSLRFYNIL